MFIVGSFWKLSRLSRRKPRKNHILGTDSAQSAAPFNPALHKRKRINMKIRGPVNFGVEKVDSAIHRNMALKLQEGQLIGANSVILAYNSPVLDDVITGQQRSIVEMSRLVRGC